MQISSTKQFAAFVMVGLMSAAVSLSTRYFFDLAVPFEAAVTLSQVVGLLVAFSLNRLFVFANSGRPVHLQFGRFMLVNAMSLAIVTGVSSLAYRIVLPWLGISFYPAVLAQLAGLGACTIPSFLGHKLFSFGVARSKRTQASAAQS